MTVQTIQPQLVHWSVDDANPPGLRIDEPAPHFLQWPELKKEVEERLLPQALGVIPQGSTITMAELHGREDYQILIAGADGATIGSLWLGKDPYNRWAYDGLVRVGKTLTDFDHVVWQVYQRYSDGTYRRVAALDGQPAPRRIGFR